LARDSPGSDHGTQKLKEMQSSITGAVQGTNRPEGVPARNKHTLEMNMQAFKKTNDRIITDNMVL